LHNTCIKPLQSKGLGMIGKLRNMPSSVTLAAGQPELLSAIARSKKLLNRRALTAAAASAVPVPGLDWAVDAALLSKLVPEINAQFGLTPQQIDQLNPGQRDKLQKAVSMVGSVLIGKFITRDLVVRAAQTIGLRLTAKTAAKFVPLAGQAVSALIGYAAIRYFGEEHIKDCVRVAKEVRLALPAPSAAEKQML
jgi:uncharacterized protein (DUF697 family)